MKGRGVGEKQRPYIGLYGFMIKGLVGFPSFFVLSNNVHRHSSSMSTCPNCKRQTRGCGWARDKYDGGSRYDDIMPPAAT